MLEKLLKSFECPITNEIMFEPVQADDGKTYEKEAFDAYVASKQVPQKSNLSPESKKSDSSVSLDKSAEILSPVTGEALKSLVTKPNDTLLSLIQSFLEEHPNYWQQVYFVNRFITEALEAIRAKDVKVLERLMDKDKRILEKEVRQGKKLIDVVCEEGTVDLVRLVLAKLKRYYPESSFTDEQKEVLLVNCFKVMPNNLNLLAEAFGWTETEKYIFALNMVRNGKIEVLEALVKGRIINLEREIDERKNTLLHEAVLSGRADVVKLLIGLGADTKQENKDGIHAQKLAQNTQQSGLAKDIAVWRREKKSEPFRLAVEARMVKVEEELRATKAENTQLREQVRYLECRHGMFGGKKMYPHDQSRQNSFVAALQAGNSGEISKLYAAGALLTEPDNNGLYPLVAAVYSCDESTINWINRELGEEATRYWAMVDLDIVRKNPRVNLPRSRPENADLEWLRNWYNEYKGAWWEGLYNQDFSEKDYSEVYSHSNDSHSVYERASYLQKVKSRYCNNFARYCGNISSCSTKWNGEKRGDSCCCECGGKMHSRGWPYSTSSCGNLGCQTYTGGEHRYPYHAPLLFLSPKQHDEIVAKIAQSIPALYGRIERQVLEAKSKVGLNF